MKGLPTNTPDPTALRALVREENKRGGRLQIRLNTRWPQDGPWMLVGNDSQRHRIRAAGTEEFLCDMMRSWRQFGGDGLVLRPA